MKPIKDKDQPKDSITESIYKSKRMVYNMVKHNLERLKSTNPAQYKHFKDIEEFLYKYESGQIEHWWEFFKQPGRYEKEEPKQAETGHLESV